MKRTHRNLAWAAGVLAIGGGIASSAEANSISVHFDTGATTIVSPDVAGYVPVSYSVWNQTNQSNDTGGSSIGSSTGGSGALIDNLGLPTTARLSFSAQTSGQMFENSTLEANFANAGDNHLFTDDIATNVNGVALNLSVTVPTAYSATGYTVYLYWTSNNTTGSNFSVTDGATTEFNHATASSVSLSSYVFSPTSATTSSSNLAAFNESSATSNFVFTPPSANAVQLFGVQIVQAPEPASIGLIGAAAAIGLLRRRRQERQTGSQIGMIRMSK